MSEENMPDEPYTKPKKGLLKSLFDMSKGVSNQFIYDGQALLKEQNYKHAMSAFRSALAENPDSYDAYIGIGQTHAALGGIQNAKMAIDAFHKATAIEMLRTDAYQACINLYNKLGDQKNAHAERKKLQTIKTLKSNPENPIANNNMGIIQLQQKSYDIAIQSFGKAARADRKNPTPQFNLTKAWYQKALKEQDEAKRKQLLKKAAQELDIYMRMNETAEGYLLKAKIFLSYGDLNNASIYCDKANQLDASLKEIYATKRVIEEKQGNIRAASEAHENYQSIKKEEGKLAGEAAAEAIPE